MPDRGAIRTADRSGRHGTGLAPLRRPACAEARYQATRSASMRRMPLWPCRTGIAPARRSRGVSRIRALIQLIPGMRRHHNGPEIVARKHLYGATGAQHFAKPGI